MNSNWIEVHGRPMYSSGSFHNEQLADSYIDGNFCFSTGFSFSYKLHTTKYLSFLTYHISCGCDLGSHSDLYNFMLTSFTRIIFVCGFLVVTSPLSFLASCSTSLCTSLTTSGYNTVTFFSVPVLMSDMTCWEDSDFFDKWNPIYYVLVT